eukprot:CAMPEP_0170621010 /NCGR_PEP_ID=MMETSP0224-20130122/28372_1 /TAXON_ID=285029 /ORGANISM="Togula jolla, Strain CCCM 725" /LENGTH=383 /DNA_ID=CAMNT_0010947239 /DNA_START=18 /DNA_END=1169 /DNA_ORIENTATION=+
MAPSALYLSLEFFCLAVPGLSHSDTNLEEQSCAVAGSSMMQIASSSARMRPASDGIADRTGAARAASDAALSGDSDSLTPSSSSGPGGQSDKSRGQGRHEEGELTASAGEVQADSTTVQYLGSSVSTRTPRSLLRKTYYINMNRSSVRRASMNIALFDVESALGIPYQRFEALPPDDDPETLAIMANDSDYRWDLWGGRWTASVNINRNHLRAWKKALADFGNSEHSEQEQGQGPSFVLVLEDDASPEASDLRHLPDTLAHVPLDAEMILLGWYGKQKPEDDTGEGRCFRATGPLGDDKGGWHYVGAHAYLLPIAKLQQLVNFLEESPNGYSMDGSTMWDPDHIRKYAILPKLVHRNSKTSKRSEHKAVDDDQKKTHAYMKSD